ncbi:hypothetical protein [Cohnella caldifontis]|uniref:hypothetical protein n=1 Tax=Cohnella caldifontis TaxID=3027471 RepID=UPI0023EDFFAD|nr:hypothetical protein [Cohnella sp. YIM B05605]
MRSAAANLLFRLGIAVFAFFLAVLAVLVIDVREGAMVIAWPYFAVVGLWLYGWYGVLGLTLGSWVLNALIGRLPDFPGRAAAKAGADLVAGAAVSWIFYAGNSVFLYSGFGIAVIYALLVRLGGWFRNASRRIPDDAD